MPPNIGRGARQNTGRPATDMNTAAAKLQVRYEFTATLRLVLEATSTGGWYWPARAVVVAPVSRRTACGRPMTLCLAGSQ